MDVAARALLVGTALLVLVTSACSADSAPQTGAGSASPHASAETGYNGDDESGPSNAREIEFDEFVDDPTALVGERVRVAGRVFFLSECPPPGAGDATCVLIGYLADPERRTFTAADAAEAVALAERGKRVSCPESGQATPTCGDWVAGAAYTVEGEVQRQVLGGRETALVQLDVVEKSAPEP
ncbi:hypothetical protein ACWGST_00200 [Agromyces sp. NPDC055520]